MFEIKREKLDFASLRGNAPGDSHEREIIRIENNVKVNTPVLIGLPGFFGSSYSFLNRSYTSPDFTYVLEKLQNDHRFIIILPDTMTSFGGNQFVNSSAVGNYEDFIVKDIVNYIKSIYGNRDLYLFGKSSGGFGSIYLTMKHPDIFNGFIDISGDSYFYYSYMPDFPVTYKTIKNYGINKFMEKYRSSYNNSQDFMTAYNIVAMSAFYSPSGKSFLLPFDPDTGRINDEVWLSWLKFDPVEIIKDTYNSLRGKNIILQTGNKDEFKIDIGMNMLHEFMNRNNINHYFKEYDAGHFNTNYFYLDSFEEILKKY